jgi:acyl-CoA synthetase (AMP-forming)/AMP-acid ligase II
MVASERWEPLTDAEGYFSTGDVGNTDGNGRLHLKGRLSTFIKRGGFRIDPFEIELVLKEMAGVWDAVVIGVPSAELGEETVAVVEPHDDMPAPKISELMAHCRRHLAASKCPGRIDIMQELPRTANGKPDRVRIRHLLSGSI